MKRVSRIPRYTPQEKEFLRGEIAKAVDQGRSPDWAGIATRSNQKFRTNRAPASIANLWHRMKGAKSDREKHVKAALPKRAQPTSPKTKKRGLKAHEDPWKILENARDAVANDLQRVQTEILRLNQEAKRLNTEHESLEAALKARIRPE